jgi:regulatory subunit for Cdc7p protein kinase
VTHVVTTRSIPAENDPISPIDSETPSVATTTSQTTSQLRSTNPRAGDCGQPPQTRSKLTFETALGRKPVLSGFRDVDPRKTNVGNADFLSRAREMGMKIWQLEKLQRVLSTMFDTPNESQAQCGRAMANQPIPKGQKEADLSRMLRNERLNGPSDRDPTVALVELAPFKGPHIYVRDMDEKTKPIMVKEYPKVARFEKGDWPQFRCVSAGKCPFVEEVDPGRLDSDRVKARGEQAVANDQARLAPKTRATTAVKKSLERPSANLCNTRQKQPLGEPRWGPNSAIPVGDKMPEEPICAPPPNTKRGRSPVKGMKNVSEIAGPRLFCGEPAASGLQPSNVTSAIRSQMVSSTAAAPGAKAGTSREFQELKRKVLERNSGAAPNLRVPQRPNEASGISRAGNIIALARKATSRTQETLDLINEGLSPSEDEDVWKADEGTRVGNVVARSMEVKERKPGYCENCRDKYYDFDDVSRLSPY